jgi:hypothetical protein
MTVSEKQQKANKKNAQKGGVKTEAGKEVSKYNAIKHGLLSEKVVLPSEDHDSYEDLKTTLKEQMNPADQIEAVLVERIASNIWRLQRLMKIESRTMSSKDEFDDELLDTFDPLRESENGHAPSMPSKVESEKLTRYERMLEKSIYKALHELQRIQSARAGDKLPAPLAVDVEK